MENDKEKVKGKMDRTWLIVREVRAQLWRAVLFIQYMDNICKGYTGFTCPALLQLQLQYDEEFQIR